MSRYIAIEGCSPTHMGSGKYRPKYVDDIHEIPCARLVIYDRKSGNKTAFLHYVDGMEIYELCPKLWEGWKLMHRLIGEKEVY